MRPNDRQATEHDSLAFLAGGGEMGERTRAFDWSKTPVGPVADWPHSLRTAVHIILNSRYPMFVWWGRRLTNFYNDAYTPMLGKRHPNALGRSAAEVWADVWPVVGPQAEAVLNEGRATWNEEKLLVMERNDFTEEAYFTFSYSPLLDDDRGVGGVFCAVTEDTHRVLSQRRLRTLRALAEQAAEAKTAEKACEVAALTLAGNPHDLPFALLYLLDGEGRRATLAGLTGMGRVTPTSPAAVELESRDSPWPFRQVAETGKGVEVQDLPKRFGPLPGGAWPESPQRAVVLPMARPGQTQLAGFLVAGVSPRLEFNDEYRGFMDLLAGHVATAVANAGAYEEERRRAEGLAELNRAKTTFFSNVSHEFRTPLTLLLGPAEDMLAMRHGPLPSGAHEQVGVIHRNALRLQKLVNTLLDFSRIEAGRIQASYEPTDLAALTADLASNFRSGCERAGLRLVVDCPPLSEPVFVDRDMWEKVVLNLLSNAFKFTLEGEIEVTLKEAGQTVHLSVRDTGTGIGAEQLPHIFERFHRVEGTRARTYEGTGIGLAFVQELVKLHGGTVAVQSVSGQGSTFTVVVPKGTAHLPADRIGTGRVRTSTALSTSHYVEEALRWLPQQGEEGGRPKRERDSSSLSLSPSSKPRVLLADDNTDMRAYVRRLLSERYAVQAVPDGAAALAAARNDPPDLVLADVMMPRLDGFGLLRELRADPRTAHLPVIMLSARAGEECRVEGMEAGADDYLVKPFSARELQARVGTHLQLAQLRRKANEALRESEERFRAMADTAPALLWVTEPDGSCSFLSRGWYQFTGQTEATALGLDWLDAVHPDDRAASRAVFLAANARHESFTLEHRLRRADGEHRWVIDAGRPRSGPSGKFLGFIGSVIDIHDRKLMEQALRLSLERLDLVVNSSQVGLWYCDLPFDKLDWSVKVKEHFGLPPDYDVTIDTFYERLHPDDRVRVRQAIERVIDNHTDYDIEYRTLGLDGKERWIRAIGRVTYNAGTPVRFDGISVDVTDRVRQQEALREADRRKDEFLATLAHELRNPLAPLRNGLQIMRLASHNREAVEQARTMMERQLGQMIRLIDDLLDVSSISRGKVELRLERVQLAAVVLQAVETSRPAIEQAGHKLTIHVPPEPIFVNADATRLAQVFVNLLNNAAKFTQRGGHVQLTVERHGSEAVVSVRDNGIGIPAPMLPKVFDIFTQADRSLERSQGGLGIGLSLVRGLVEMHGGLVAARSEGHGMGSEFVVRLPVVLSLVAEQPATAEAVRPSARRRILVVDDNRDSAISLAMVLKIMGNETQTAHDGQEGLEVAAVFRPDVILLDIEMPKLNGYEAVRRIQEQPWARNVVLVALTGWGHEDDRRRSLEAGFHHHLVKPVEPAALEKLLIGLQEQTA